MWGWLTGSTESPDQQNLLNNTSQSTHGKRRSKVQTKGESQDNKSQTKAAVKPPSVQAPLPTNDVSATTTILADSERQGTENIISKSDIESYFQSDFRVKIDASVFEINKSITQLRRYFHETPELSWKEFNTSKAIAKYLRARNLEVYENIAQTGVIGILRGKGSNSGDGPCILLRADMDALPVLEKNDVSWKSKNVGIMHACGHDCHMAILLSVARILTMPQYCNKIHGTIKFCFQPAEEGGGGAKFMIDENILELDEKNDIPRVDQVYGLHVWSYEKFGKCVVRDGALMAGSDHFDMKIMGLGGHGAEPKGTNDAIVAATQLVLQFHTVISRNLSPLEEGVLTVGKLESGNRGNIIAESAYLEGTFRWFTKSVELRIRKRISEIIKGIETSFNVKIEINFGKVAYPPTINNRKCMFNVAKAVSSVLPDGGVIASEPTMAAEDFSFFLNERPGCYFFLGCGVDEGNDAVYAHHKPDFKVDERCLVTGVQIFVNLVLNLMQPRIANYQSNTVSVPSKSTTILPKPVSNNSNNNNDNNNGDDNNGDEDKNEKENDSNINETQNRKENDINEKTATDANAIMGNGNVTGA